MFMHHNVIHIFVLKNSEKTYKPPLQHTHINNIQSKNSFSTLISRRDVTHVLTERIYDFLGKNFKTTEVVHKCHLAVPNLMPLNFISE